MERTETDVSATRSGPPLRLRRLRRIARALEAAAVDGPRPELHIRGRGPAARVARAAARLLERQEELFRTIGRAAAGRSSPEVEEDGERVAGFTQARALVLQLAWQRDEAAAVFSALDRGDLSRTVPSQGADGAPLQGSALRTAQALNSLVRRLAAIRSEVIRIAEEVGTAGRLGGRAEVEGASGAWKELIDGVNLLALNLTSQVRNIALVTGAVARGDLSRKITVPAHGEILDLKETINDMVGQLRAFSAEVTRVAREVGRDGELGGQARVPGVSGTWKDLTDSVNMLAGNLTAQVRNIAAVTTAVAHGDLSRKITVDARGEILELKSTVNGMVDQLRAFTAEVTRVTREVGANSAFGEQASVPGVAGSWKDLTDSINEMIVDLRESTRANEEQDWLKTNLARFSALLQGERDLQGLAGAVLAALAPEVCAQYGALFAIVGEGEKLLELVSTYGGAGPEPGRRFRLGEGPVGQCARDRRTVFIDDLPADYVRIRSGVGEAPPRSLIVLPILFEGDVRGALELASFRPFGPAHRALLEQLAQSIGVVFNTIATSTRTAQLLGELRASNAELEKRTAELEDKARQVALVSRYKSDFLANVSHELRTPLNSLLILARFLADNDERNLTRDQVEYARTIHSSGQELLALINQILDLAKIESGKLQVDLRPVAVREVAAALERSFRPTAPPEVEFSVSVAPDVPEAVRTDGQRLQQILRNLLANAFKFTPRGRVELSIGRASSDAGPADPLVVLAFAVCDTGIGIPADKQELVFEAFQQADPSINRAHGGTGLGLTISRDLATLLGGRIRLRSAPGEGSTFTLELPVTVEAAPGPEVPAPTPSPPRQPGRSEPGLAGLEVLVVDDDAHNLFAVTTLLEKLGVRVLVANSAAECFERLDAHRDVDVVLMDVMMPEMDGLEATQRIRRRPGLEQLPIVALTAKALPGDRKRCFEAGCSDFEAKPVSPEALIALLRKWGRR